MRNRVAILITGAANSGFDLLAKEFAALGIENRHTKEMEAVNASYFPIMHTIEGYQVTYCAIKAKINKVKYRNALRPLLKGQLQDIPPLVCFASETIATYLESYIHILYECGYDIKLIKTVEELTQCTTFMTERDGIHRNKAATIYNSCYVAFGENLKTFLDLKRSHIIVNKQDWLKEPDLSALVKQLGIMQLLMASTPPSEQGSE